MLWTFTAFILRRLWGYIFVILVFAGLVGLVVLAYWFWPQWTAGDFDKRTRILEILMLASGALSIVMLAAQLRQQAAWNKVLSFHEYFSDVPSPDNVVALHATFRRLNIELPNYADPLSDANSDLIIGDTTVDADIGNGRRARVIVQAYLDDLEEFCAAVNADIVSDSYARDIEGTRTIRAFLRSRNSSRNFEWRSRNWQRVHSWPEPPHSHCDRSGASITRSSRGSPGVGRSGARANIMFPSAWRECSENSAGLGHMFDS